MSMHVDLCTTQQSRRCQEVLDHLGASCHPALQYSDDLEDALRDSVVDLCKGARLSIVHRAGQSSWILECSEVVRGQLETAFSFVYHMSSTTGLSSRGSPHPRHTCGWLTCREGVVRSLSVCKRDEESGELVPCISTQEAAMKAACQWVNIPDEGGITARSHLAHRTHSGYSTEASHHPLLSL